MGNFYFLHTLPYFPHCYNFKGIVCRKKQYFFNKKCKNCFGVLPLSGYFQHHDTHCRQLGKSRKKCVEAFKLDEYDKGKSHFWKHEVDCFSDYVTAKLEWTKLRIIEKHGDSPISLYHHCIPHLFLVR